MELERLIAGLSDPGAYPEGVGEVEVVQTHISAVFLAGDRAYKIKKPLDLGFLDFTTLDLRHRFCREEVRLNRRLAPDVYLGVAPIHAEQGRLSIGPVVDLADDAAARGDGGDDARAVRHGVDGAVEYAVVMRRLPDDRTLESLLDRDRVDRALLNAVAERVAAFHAAAAAGPEVARWGDWDTVAHNARENFEQIEPSVGLTISRRVFDRLRAITESDLSRLEPLMRSRAAGGVPRDTHGDLHLKHVYAFDDEPSPDDLVVVDCIEFNERFRYADPVSDIAFLDMDLRYRGRADLAHFLSDAYFAASGDDAGRSLLPYYVGYRAIVRGKVDGFLAGETEVPEEVRADAASRARAYFLLALGVVEAPARRPALVLSTGLPGTGKSWLASWLAASHGFHTVSTDEVRKGLAGLSPSTDASAPVDQGIYTPAWTERTYQACLESSRELLLEGCRVVVDGTFQEDARREAFAHLARKLRVPFVVFASEASRELVRDRLSSRSGTASDADWAIYEAVAERWEPWGATVRPAVVTIDTGVSNERTRRQAMATLDRNGLV